MKEVKIRFPDNSQYTREELEADADKAQKVLEKAKGQYPVCLCRKEGVRMYIAYRNYYYLARCPNSGPEHAPYCPSYEPDPELTGRGIYAKNAVIERPDGFLSVKLGVPLQIRNTQKDESAEQEPSPSPSTGGGRRSEKKDSMKLSGLLNLLWENAGFNRWSPKMKGKRRYSVIQKYLYQASDKIFIQRKRLSEQMYIPEPFKQENANAINLRRQKLFREFTQNKQGLPKRMIVIGQVKKFGTSKLGYGIRLGHTPEGLMFWFEERLYRRLVKTIDFAAPDLHNLDINYPIFVALAVERTKDHAWLATDLGAMVTTKDYIPINSYDEAALCQRLIETDRYFYKPMNYDDSKSCYPNFLLTDVGSSAVPLEIFAEKDSDLTIASRNQRIADYQEHDKPYWSWDVFDSNEPPAIIASSQ